MWGRVSVRNLVGVRNFDSEYAVGDWRRCRGLMWGRVCLELENGAQI